MSYRIVFILNEKEIFQRNRADAAKSWLRNIAAKMRRRHAFQLTFSSLDANFFNLLISPAGNDPFLWFHGGQSYSDVTHSEYGEYIAVRHTPTLARRSFVGQREKIAGVRGVI